MGLELRRDKDRNLRSKWWYGRYMVNGQRRFVNLGVEVKGKVPQNLRQLGDTAFECSRTLAAAKLKDFLAEATSCKTAEKHLQELYEIKSGEAISQIPVEEIDSRRFVLPARKERSAQREVLQLNALKSFREYIQGAHPAVRHISQITKAMSRGWLSSLDAQNYSASTYNDKLHIVKSFFDRVGDEAGVSRNPFAGCPTKVKQPVHRQPFTLEELSKILLHCDAIIRPVVITGMCTAMRRGDCCRLKWEAVDLEGGFVMVKTSKTGEMAEIPLFPVLRNELENLPRQSEYVFPEAAEMYRTNPDGITWRFQKALKGAAIQDVEAPEKKSVRRTNLKDFHSLRTTWITMALSAGVPMELVRRVTGHSTVNIVLKHYFRPGREDFRNALETALPQSMTGRTDKKKSPAEQLQKLVEKADKLAKKKLVEEMAKIAEQLAA